MNSTGHFYKFRCQIAIARIMLNEAMNKIMNKMKMAAQLETKLNRGSTAKDEAIRQSTEMLWRKKKTGVF